MSQDRAEHAGAFAAPLCDQGLFVILECLLNTGYLDHMVAHHLVKGIGDTEIQDQVLSYTPTNSDLDLSSISKFI